MPDEKTRMGESLVVVLKSEETGKKLVMDSLPPKEKGDDEDEG